jgi:copper homeostasis protein
MDRKDFEIEICTGNIGSVLAADRGGADRVELCENLAEGGTTPSFGTMVLAKEKSSLAVYVIIRPRGGDFVYSDTEMEVMLRDIQSAVEMGADGMVIGCLKPDGRVDLEKCRRLMEAGRGLPVTFHRAFDLTPDPFEALEDIKSMGISRILTSGQKEKAEDGMELLRELAKNAGTGLRIMAGSGIDESNIRALALGTGLHSFHASLREIAGERSPAGRKAVLDSHYQLTKEERVRALIKLMGDL